MVAEMERCPGCEIREQLQEQLPSRAKGVRVKLIPNPDLFPSKKETV